MLDLPSPNSLTLSVYFARIENIDENYNTGSKFIPFLLRRRFKKWKSFVSLQDHILGHKLD